MKREMKSLLVTGASGLLGDKIVKLARRKYSVIPTHKSRQLQPDSLRLDITNAEDITSLFKKLEPDVIIHTASETNVDKCETKKENARRVNVGGTHNIALACASIDAKLLYISTDYVFDGEKGNYNEQDKPNPINYYGVKA